MNDPTPFEDYCTCGDGCHCDCFAAGCASYNGCKGCPCEPGGGE